MLCTIARAQPAPSPPVAEPEYNPATPATGPYILTPAPGLHPQINGARVFGVRPGSPFLFTVAATGEAPLAYSALGLPDGSHGIQPPPGEEQAFTRRHGHFARAACAFRQREKTFR